MANNRNEMQFASHQWQLKARTHCKSYEMPSWFSHTRILTCVCIHYYVDSPHICVKQNGFFELSKQKKRRQLLVIKQTQNVLRLVCGQCVASKLTTQIKFSTSFKSFYSCNTHTNGESSRWLSTLCARYVIGLDWIGLDWPEWKCEICIEFGTKIRTQFFVSLLNIYLHNAKTIGM